MPGFYKNRASLYQVVTDVPVDQDILLLACRAPVISTRFLTPSSTPPISIVPITEYELLADTTPPDMAH
jgi:hypothetical protein